MIVRVRKNDFLAVLIPLLIFSLIVPREVRSGGESDQSDPFSRTEVLIDKLGSPFFLVRDGALKALEKVDERSIPPLIDALSSSDPRVISGCLSVLTQLIPRTAWNSRIREFLDHQDEEVRQAAIRFLASHPEPTNMWEAAWAERLLSSGTNSEIKSYITSTRRPAPPFQTGLILENLAGFPDALQQDAIRAMARGSRADASVRLLTCFRRVQAGLLGKDKVLTILDGLEENVDRIDLEIIADSLLAASPRVRQKANVALSRLKAHLYRLRDFEALVDLNRELCRLFPRSIDYRLDLADSLLLYGNDAASSRHHIDKVLLSLESDFSTPALLQKGDALVGLALASYRQGKDEWKKLLDRVPADLKATPGDFSGYIQARAFLLHGALIAAEGGDGRPFFRKAIAIAPYRQDDPLIDRCLSGRFSVRGLVWILGREGKEESCLGIYSQAAEALRGDDSGSDYFPSPDAIPQLDDRTRSSLPLVRAMFQRYEWGDPKLAIESLNEFINVVQDSGYLNNLDLAAKAYFARGAAEIDLDDLAISRDSIGKGLRICDELLGEYRDGRKKEKLLFYTDLIRSCSRMKARGLLQLATLKILSGEGPGTESGLIREAASLAPALPETLMSEGIRLARRGCRAGALEIAAAVEEYPDQFYNKACLYLLVEEEGKALKYLSRHFREYVKPRRLDLARKYALADPDLRSVRKDARFLEILGVK